MADAECFSGGSIAGAVIGTFLATLVLGAFLVFLWNQYRKRRAQSSPLHDLVMVEDGDRRLGEEEPSKKNFSYDNPGFFDDSTDPKKHISQSYGYGIRQNGTGQQVANQDSSAKSKHLPWGPLTFLFNRNARKARDDSALEEPLVYSASLKGHDFTGLGFNICGNMRDGIFIKDVMQRGPAAESKKILPGDRITSLTISFKHIVLDDALTLLSYASPYDVTLDMVRLPEKSLSHKGIHLLSGSGGGQGSSSSSPTTDMVCHPFFKSQSIDDLRSVGKEHMSLKNENGIKSQACLSTPVTSAPKETHSSKGSAKGKMDTKATPQKQAQKGSSTPSPSPKSQDTTVTVTITSDEPDMGRGEINAQSTKPELIPRVKSKTINVKSETMPPPGIVEAISPVVKMELDNVSQPRTPTPSAPIIKPLRNNVKIECAEVPDPILQHMTGVSSKLVGAESQSMASVTPSDVSITIEQEQTVVTSYPVKKPERQKKGLLSALKEKRSSTDHEKAPREEERKDSVVNEEENPNKEQEKSKLGKFGMRIPDINLHFGKKTPDKDDHEQKATTPSPKKEKRKKDKAKEKKSEEPEPTIGPSEVIIGDAELDLSLATPKSGNVNSPEEESAMKSSDERPPSTDSLDSTEKPTNRKSSGFHLPNIGIKLPKFGHSKQYNLEADDDRIHSEHGTPSSKADKHANISLISPSVTVKKLDYDDELANDTIRSQVPMEETGTSAESQEKEESKEKAGFMSKGLQSLRDFKDKVSHKLSSSHDSPSSSSSEDEEDGVDGAGGGDKAKKLKKEKKEARDRSADAKLREKQEKEERAKDKAKEKERLKAEKAAKKAELKRKSSKQTSDSTSSDESDRDESRQPKKKSKSKGKKAKETTDASEGAPAKMAAASKDIDDTERIETVEVIQEVTKTSQMQNIKSKLIPAKPPVAPRKSKDVPKKGTEEEKAEKRLKRKCASSKSSSTSNGGSGSSSGSDSEGKVNKLAKRQAPTPPVSGDGVTTAKGNILVTKAEVTEAPRDVHQHHHSAPPEIVEATVKPKSKIPVKISTANNESSDSSRSRTPDKRSASFADLSSLQSTPKSKLDSLERAVSMDMGSDGTDGKNTGNAHIPNMVMSPVEDLSTATDSTMTAAGSHYKHSHSQQSFSSNESGSSSSETLKASPSSIVQRMQATTIQVHKSIQETATMMSMEPPRLASPSSIDVSIASVVNSRAQPNAVTITTGGTCSTDECEVEKVAVAQSAVDEILAKVNHSGPQGKDGNRMSIDVMDQTANNVTIMNIRNALEPEQESTTKVLGIQIEDSSTKPEAKADSKQLLRGDSKSRLMQLVADANEIKITQKSPKKDSSSPQVSPEIQSDNKPLFKTNGASTKTAPPPVNGQTIEITSTELDGIMMSHSDFLARQAMLHPVETLPNEPSSFDNWVYVDQKHEGAVTSIEESSTSQAHRNGALSPARTSYKTAIEFETSELKVTTASPSPAVSVDQSYSQSTSGKLYSTTMTLPQKAITQIILGPESSQNIEITSPLPTFK